MDTFWTVSIYSTFPWFEYVFLFIYIIIIPITNTWIFFSSLLYKFKKIGIQFLIIVCGVWLAHFMVFFFSYSSLFTFRKCCITFPFLVNIISHSEQEQDLFSCMDSFFISFSSFASSFWGRAALISCLEAPSFVISWLPSCLSFLHVILSVRSLYICKVIR